MVLVGVSKCPGDLTSSRILPLSQDHQCGHKTT